MDKESGLWSPESGVSSLGANNCDFPCFPFDFPFPFRPDALREKIIEMKTTKGWGVVRKSLTPPGSA